jgi:hypothetical protein
VTGEGLRDAALQLAGNIFLAVVALAAITFLVKREFVRFAEFALLAVLVATFVFVPEVWVGIGRAVAGVLSDGG